MAFDHSSLRCFEACSCKPTPRDLPSSLTQLRTLYIKVRSWRTISTLRKVIVTLNQVMNYAARQKYIEFNPVRDAERPKDQGRLERPKIKILSPSEINALIEAEEKQEYRTQFMLAIMSGARQGELIGLKWTDVDWFNNQIHIQRTFNHGRWYKPKSKNSNRKIDLGPAMMEALKKWSQLCPKGQIDLIFPNPAGSPIDQSAMLRKHFFPCLEKAGISRIRFHDLRHTYASLLIDQGENIKYIQSQLGHSSPVVTLEVYAHLMKSINREAPCKLENTIFEKSGSKTVAEKKKGAMIKLITP